MGQPTVALTCSNAVAVLPLNVGSGRCRGLELHTLQHGEMYIMTEHGCTTD